jgi:hypothetical protein
MRCGSLRSQRLKAKLRGRKPRHKVVPNEYGDATAAA